MSVLSSHFWVFACLLGLTACAGSFDSVAAIPAESAAIPQGGTLPQATSSPQPGSQPPIVGTNFNQVVTNPNQASPSNASTNVNILGDPSLSTLLNADGYILDSFINQHEASVESSATSDNAQVVNAHVTFPPPLWHFVFSASGNTFALRNTFAGKCMDIAAGSKADGVPVVINTCSTTSSQQWTATIDANMQTAEFQNVGSGLCLTASDDPNDGAPLLQRTCTRTAGQFWHILPKTIVSGDSLIAFATEPNNAITSLSYDMIVPPLPAGNFNTLFSNGVLTPQVTNPTLAPVGLGTLEAVLTWGNSCAPGPQPTPWTTWWISGQYIGGDATSPVAHGACLGGNPMPVSPGDTLHVSMVLNGTRWAQHITDAATGQSVDFDVDLLGQDQSIVAFDFDNTQLPSAQVYKNVQFTARQPDDSFCVQYFEGHHDAATPGVVSADRRTCYIAVLQVVPAGGAALSNP